MRSLPFTLTLTLAAILAACGGSSSAPPANSGAGAAPTKEAAAPAATEMPPTAAPTEAPAAVGSDVTVGGVVWKITKAEDRGKEIKGEFTSAKTTARFVWVEGTVTNKGTEQISISGPKVKDSTGREFETSSDAIMVIPNDKSCVLENANPGISKECIWVYEVPADATGLKLQAGDGKLFGGAEPVGIDLGL